MSHLVGEMFKKQAGIDITAVPYKGGVLAVQDLLAGQVQMIFSDALPVMQHIRAGKLRALGITSKDRSPLSPEIPTMAEQGFPDLVAVNWWGVLVPAGTPKADHRQAQRRPREGARHAGREGEVRRTRRRAGVQHARAVRELSSRARQRSTAS